MGWTDRLYPGKKGQFESVTDVQMVARRGGAGPSAQSPVIAISGANSKSKSVAAMMTMVRTLGATPLFIGNHAERVKGGVEQGVAEVLHHANAVIVMGNDGDIDPARYGAQAVADTKIEQDKARAAFEEELIRQSIGAKVPLMGICGGMQRINVMCGGTLHQHIPALTGDNHHAQGDFDIPPFVPVQQVTIKGGTALAAMTGSGTDRMVNENSFHHQAVDVVPEGLRVNAVSADGVAQGLEVAPGGKFDGQFILGVQWHPEFAASEVGPKLVNAVIEAGKGNAQAYPRAQDKIAIEFETLRSVLPDVKPELKEKFTAALAAQRSAQAGQTLAV